jgi:D-serine deaminase-like pyridoxal phosphate-dependent protein
MKLVTRRNVLIGAGVLATGGIIAARDPDRGGAHEEYFTALSAALKNAGVAQPALVIDRARLRQNIDALKQALFGKPLALRIVVKSLPATQLIDEIASRAASTRFMVFNGPMLIETAKRGSGVDLLLGKPLPALAARQFYDAMSRAGVDAPEPQWLIDTPERLQQYAQLARDRPRPLRVNFEIDVGLHRGGAASPAALLTMVQTAQAEPQLEVSGLMGYDAHVPKVPGRQRAWQGSQRQYSAALDAMRSVYGERVDRMTLNSAGSPTYTLHAAGTVANEVSVGSAFVKPTDFDLDTLQAHTPAAFIATPVLKTLEEAQVPGLEPLTGLRRFMDPNTQRAIFIHGGHWLARPTSPPGLQFSSLYGRSSNQELLTGSASVRLRPDDYVFFRPTQSEAVLLQFGDLLVYENGEITERWPTFGVSA